MHAIRPSYDAITRAVRWTVLVLAVVLAMLVVLLAVVTAPARADPGQTPDQTGPDQEQAELLLAAGDHQRHRDRHVRRPVRQRALGRRLRHPCRGGLRLPVPGRAGLQRGLPRRRLRRRLPRLPAGSVHLVGGLPPGDAQRAVVLQLVRRPALGQRLRLGQGRQGHRPQARQVPGRRRDRLVQARPRLLRRGRLQRRHHPDLGDEHRRPQRLPLHHRQPRHERLPRQVHPPRRRRSGRHHSADRTDRRTSGRPPRPERRQLARLERHLGGRGLPRAPQRGADRRASAGRPTATATRWPGRRPPTRWSPTTRPGTPRARAG